jgi:hypothetical protein
MLVEFKSENSMVVSSSQNETLRMLWAWGKKADTGHKVCVTVTRLGELETSVLPANKIKNN